MLLKMVSHERIGMVVDLWNWAVAGTSLDQFDNLTEAQITEVRLADPVGAITADATPDQRAMPAVDGPAGCVAALTKLAELGYRGAVTIAPHPSHNQGSREEIVRALVETYDALFNGCRTRCSRPVVGGFLGRLSGERAGRIRRFGRPRSGGHAPARHFPFVAPVR